MQTKPVVDINKPLEFTKLTLIFKEWDFFSVFWWGQYYIDQKMLVFYDVYNTRAVYNKSKRICEGTYNRPIFTYLSKFTGEFKFQTYNPYSEYKKYKWFSDTHADIMHGYLQLDYGKLPFIIITKSMKDVMVLRMLGYNAVAFQGEVIHEISDYVLKALKLKTNNLLLFFDNDETGVKYSTMLSEKYNIPTIFMPDYLSKDISDYVQMEGTKKAKNLMKELTNYYIK